MPNADAAILAMERVLDAITYDAPSDLASLNCAQENDFCTIDDSASSSVSVPFSSVTPPSQECEIPCGRDGLPSEETFSFLFDDVSQEVVARRAEHEPAYRRLAALRERILARLNLPNG